MPPTRKNNIELGLRRTILLHSPQGYLLPCVLAVCVSCKRGARFDIAKSKSGAIIIRRSRCLCFPLPQDFLNARRWQKHRRRLRQEARGMAGSSKSHARFSSLGSCQTRRRRGNSQGSKWGMLAWNSDALVLLLRLVPTAAVAAQY